MFKEIKIVCWLCCFFSLWSIAQLYSQSEAKIDSIIKSTTINIYENPNNAIKIGKDIASNNSLSATSRTRGYMLVSDGYSSLRNYEKSLEYLNKANQLSKQLNDPILRIKIINKTAIQYQQLKIYDKTIHYLDEAEQLISLYPIPDSVLLYKGSAYIIRGLVYKEKLNCEIALIFLDKGINEYSKLSGAIAKANSSIAYYNKGNCYILLNDYESALQSFQRSIDMAKIVNAKSLQAFAQKGLAEVLTLKGEFQDAVIVLEEALVTSKEVGDLILNQGLYKGLSENYLALNNWDEYQKYNSLYLQARYKVKESERTSTSDSLDQLAKETDLKLTNTLSKYNYGIIAVFVVLIVIIILFILYQRKCSKDILRLQNEVDNLQNKSVN
jgi:tetratricopeptide (TPR) repeat protein